MCINSVNKKSFLHNKDIEKAIECFPGKETSTVKQIFTLLQRHFPAMVDERRDLTDSNHFVSMWI